MIHEVEILETIGLDEGQSAAGVPLVVRAAICPNCGLIRALSSGDAPPALAAKTCCPGVADIFSLAAAVVVDAATGRALRAPREERCP